MTSTKSRFGRIASGGAGWLVLLFVFVALFTVGVARDAGPSTPQERIDAVSKRLACPTCDGESVYESRGSASVAIRNEVARLVADGELGDDEIVATIVSTFPDSLLVPRSSGIESLVWVLPVAAGVVAAAGLVAVFVRWRRQGSQAATDEDRRLVEKARGS
ncbi:MAG: cytochrome c-type biogenesis protein CcmH [Ilumatobacteraceae bacterium]